MCNLSFIIMDTSCMHFEHQTDQRLYKKGIILLLQNVNLILQK